MTVTLPDELIQSARLTEAGLKAELALALFQQERLTLGQAALLGGLPQLDFQRLLASRRIPLHYGLEAMEQDIERAKGWQAIDRRFRCVAHSQPRRRKPASSVT
jgi:predicted HTH domain antitoxin